MTRICLMGDSHAAALKRGWQRIAHDFPDTEITFFAGDKNEWHAVHADGIKLAADSTRLREQFLRSAKGIDTIVADFDAYIVGSLGLGTIMPLGFWTSGQYPQWGAYRAAVNAYVRLSGCAHILGQLRTITRAPVVFVAEPFRPLAFCRASPELDAATAAKLQALFEEEFRALAAAHGAVYVPQPEETIAPNGLTTKMEFAAISRDPSRQDTRHCNEDYGALVMTDILEALAHAA